MYAMSHFAYDKCDVAHIAYIAYVHRMQKRNLMSTTVRVLENRPEKRSGTESLLEVFLHNKRAKKKLNIKILL
jgi:hypothetical protein